jgi:hypothetical protein
MQGPYPRHLQDAGGHRQGRRVLTTMTLAGALAIAAALQAPAVTTAFEGAAAEANRFVDAGCVLYDRAGDSRLCAAQAGTSLRGLYRIADLEALTRHADPNVRTLALVRLFALGDPTVLPIIFALTGDKAGTFPAHLAVSLSYGVDYKEVPTKPQTVGSIAEYMMDFYLQRAGYSYGSAGTGGCPGFNQYWRERKDRTALASWLTVELDRATQGTSPIPTNRAAHFAALRERVERIGGDDRLWYSLLVGAGDGGDRVFNEAETMAAAKALGPDRLMQLLLGRAPASDPDLVPVGRPDSCGAVDVGGNMRRFLLERAALLLRPSDADVLLQTPSASEALWAIAAAALRPDRAEAILKPAIAKLDRRVFGWDQAKMAAALPRIAGDTHVPYALDWFYGRMPGETVTNAQEIFINEVVQRGGRSGRALLAALVTDGRFDRISTPALQRLIVVIDDWLPETLVDSPYQSLGTDESKVVAGWRALVRQSVPRWK